MNKVEKFLSDVEKILKFDRHENGGKSNYLRVKGDLRKLFIKSSSCPGDLPNSIFDYWEKTYVLNKNPLEEPSEKNRALLCGFFAYLENSLENLEFISDDDWKEIAKLVNFEAEDLPVNVLSSLMSVIVEKGFY